MMSFPLKTMTMDTSLITLYPLKFDLIYMSKIWGGDRIFPFKGIPSPTADIGESWEISPMAGYESVVSNGALKGENLVELTKLFGSRLLGKQVCEHFGGEFPLLIKMIDANADLSVQVHPNDEYALRHHNSRGKTEMWYLLDATSDAKIFAGWKKRTNPDQLKEIVKTDEVMEYLDVHYPKRGDVFYLPAGKVHTIGAGCLILEIQEASDITYRMYDFNRTDAKGHKRELHIDRSAEVVDYEINTKSTEHYDRDVVDNLETVVDSPYFRVSVLSLTHDFELPVRDRDSFTVLFVEEGEVILAGDGFDSVSAAKGETLLVPAEINQCTIKIKGEKAKLIDCFIPC